VLDCQEEVFIQFADGLLVIRVEGPLDGDVIPIEYRFDGDVLSQPILTWPMIRNGGELVKVSGTQKLPTGKSAHVMGMLDADAKLRLYVDGRCVARTDGQFIASKPADGLSVGADTGSFVGEYKDKTPFNGLMSDIRVYWGVLDDASIRAWVAKTE